MNEHQDQLRHLAKICAISALSIFCLLAAYITINRERIFPSKSDIVIYGTYQCGITTALRDDLTYQNIPFTFVDVNGFLPNQEMQYFLQHLQHQVPKQGHVLYPVVRIAGKLFERPDHSMVLQLHDTASKSP